MGSNGLENYSSGLELGKRMGGDSYNHNNAFRLFF
jgi:hypothetical protein